MLVHKRTLGVLRWYWDGVSYRTFEGVQQPKLVPVRLEHHNLKGEEWWQVPDGTPLARKISLCYPFFDPVEVEGQLVDAIPWPPWKRYGEAKPPPAAAERKQGRYNRRRTKSGT